MTPSPSPSPSTSSPEGLSEKDVENLSEKEVMQSSSNNGPVEKGSETDAVAPQGKSEEHEYPPFRQVILIMVALYLGVFLVSIDRTIISTAIPRMTDDFHALDDVGWFGSGYMLTTCAFVLILGRVYTFYPPKWVFLTLIFVFEVGSAICGAAPNATVFIVGRAIAGLGAAGIFNGAIVLMVNTVPLRKRPLYMGLIGAVFGVSSVIGPLMGGAFTSNLSWRWCFYINLPIGGVTMIILTFILKNTPAPKAGQPLRQQIRQLDPFGTMVFIPAIVCLLLALQWGGSTYPWNDARIIALLVLFSVLFIAFIAIQIWQQENATVPPRIVCQRSVAFGLLYTLCNGSAMMILVYYIPIWFQAIKNASPVRSGIMTLPLLLALVVGTISAGASTRRIGYYVPLMFASSILTPIGSGLITTFTPSTNHAKWIGFLVLYGFGLGIGFQQPNMAAQTVLTRADVSTGIALMMFGMQLGGAIFVSVGQNILDNRLISGIKAVVPGIDAQTIVNAGATEIRNIVSPEHLPLVLKAYNHALTSVYCIALGTSCLTIIGALGMEWKNINTANPDKAKPENPKPAEAEAEAEPVPSPEVTKVP